MLKIIPTTVAILLSVSSVALAGGDRTRLRCDADGAGDITMDARYEARGNRDKFDASFEALAGGNFAAGDILTVSVGGNDVGGMTLTVNPLNGDIEGDLEFDSQVEPNDDSIPFPGNFPAVSDGTSVVVGPIGCALED